MAAINPPAWLQAGSYPARTDRLSAVTAHLYYAGYAIDEATPLRPRAGVRPSYQNYQLKVRAAATPTMTVIVSAGIAWVDNHDISAYGTYVMVNDADVTLTISPAGGAGQYRKDTIGFTTYDAETAGSANECRLEVIQGPYASSAGATVPGTIPPNMVTLAYVAVAPSQTSVASGNISDLRNYTVALGGIAPIPSTISPDHPHPGQMWYEPDLDRFRYGTSAGAVKSLAPDWQTYTPVWAATGTAPNLGNGSLVGRYVLNGKSCTAIVEQVMGSSTSMGTGTYSWSLPFPAASPAGTSANFTYMGSARAHGAQWFNGVVGVLKGANVLRVYGNAAPQEWSTSQPMTWTASNTQYLHAQVTYEIA